MMQNKKHSDSYDCKYTLFSSIIAIIHETFITIYENQCLFLHRLSGKMCTFAQAFDIM